MVLIGHTKLKSTLRYLGVQVDDALEIAEHTVVGTEIVTSSPNPPVRNGSGLTPSHRRDNGCLIAASRCAAENTLAGMRVRWYGFLQTARHNVLRLDFTPRQRRRDTPGPEPGGHGSSGPGVANDNNN